MTDYIDRPTGYDLCLAGPYRQRGVNMRSYALRASPADLQAMLDRYLNEAPGHPPPADGVRYVPLAGIVMLTVVNMKHVSAANEGLGWMREVDVALQVPVIRHRHGSLLPDWVGVFMPYLWVNNQWPMITGRDSLGFRKEIGVFTADGSLPDTAAEVDRVECYAIPRHGAELRSAKLIELASASANIPERFQGKQAIEKLLERILDVGVNLGVDLMSAVDSDQVFNIPCVFLKQLRDSKVPQQAVVHEVLTANGVVPWNSVEAGFVDGDHRIRITNYLSHPIVEECGLAAGSDPGKTDELTPLFVFDMNYDFDMDLPGGAHPRKKVAVLGGGPAGLAAAMDVAGRGDLCELDVYQMGWRLGGKCASGRDASDHDRNGEHGLHLPMGFYENTFDLLRSAYADMNRTPDEPLATWEKAFLGRDTLTLTEKVGQQWDFWKFDFPKRAGVPGDDARRTMAGVDEDGWDLNDLLKEIHDFLGRLLTIVHDHPVVSWTLGDALDQLRDLLLGDVDDRGPVATIVNGLLSLLQPLDGFRRTVIMLDLGWAMADGLLDLIEAGDDLQDINHLEFTEWLNQHAALGSLTQITLESSALRMVYELVFAFEAGDSTKPAIAAGVAVNGLARLLVFHKGSVTYDMAAGMGETVVTPFYEAIQLRNPHARFHFFHRVRKLALSADKQRVEEIHLEVQATTRGGLPYRPLIDVKGLPCWPSRPLYDQLEEGDALRAGTELPGGGYALESSYTEWAGAGRKVLKRGTHFDEVILAIPSPALADICDELVEHVPGWRKMLEATPGVATTSMQFWMSATPQDLGWPEQGHPLVGAFASPLGTWLDLSLVVPHEAWDGTDCVAQHGFCGPWMLRGDEPPTPDTPAGGFLATNRDAQKAGALSYTETQIPTLMPGLLAGADFRWDVFMAPADMDGRARGEAQYFRANVSPSERYVLSLPGTIQHRKAPDESGVTNLTLAGDWTRCGLNVGALEAAVTSGRMAARAVMGLSYAIYGEDG